MADAKLFIGGTPNPLYPNCNGALEFREPHARRIAYEYSNGFYTLGWPFNPADQKYQRQELISAEVGVGDHIMLYPVPEQHLLTGVLFEVWEGDPTTVGAAVKPSAMLYDATTGEYTEDDVLDALFSDTAINGASDVYGHLETPFYVPKGQTLVLSLKVVALPSDATVKLHNTVAKLGLIAKVQGFDIPTEV